MKIKNNRKGRTYEHKTETFLGTSIVNSNTNYGRLIDYIPFEPDKKESYETNLNKHHEKVNEAIIKLDKKEENQPQSVLRTLGRKILTILDDIKKSANTYSTGTGTLINKGGGRRRYNSKTEGTPKRWKQFIDKQEVMEKDRKTKVALKMFKKRMEIVNN